MLKEKQRVNRPKLKIIITIIIFTHSSDINSMPSHHKRMIIFIISQKDRDWETERREEARDWEKEIEIVHII